MSLWWLIYRQRGTVAVMLVDASLLGAARMRADLELVRGIDAHFVEGHELDAASAARVPARMIGQMLSAAEAGRLIARLERGARLA